MKKMIWFISGPMSNLPDYNRPEFNKVEAHLKYKYPLCIVLNPAVHPAGLTHTEYMVLCQPMVQVSTHIYFLKNWEKSKGSNIEYGWAINWDKVIEKEVRG